MPKQKRYDFKHLQGSSSSKQNTKDDKPDNSALSVNERLLELRIADPATAETKKRELVDSLNQHSLPEHIQGLLGVPRNAPPRPRIFTRPRRGTPGPVPPSWLRGDTGGSRVSTTAEGKRPLSSGQVRARQHELFRFQRLSGHARSMCNTRSLVHTCMKRVAKNWSSLDVDEQQAILELPPKLRLLFISYISYYGYSISFDLFTACIDGNETIEVIDLAGLVGYDTMTLSRMTRHIKASSASKKLQPELDSWDKEVLTESLRVVNFSNLTHLCLSHPAETVSWTDLLSLTKHTRAVTHLSLAYWPRPTLTPNLATTVVANKRGPDVSAGGSHFYSEMDDDLAEPRAVLRKLSHNLLRLTWLDIEGNPYWLLAMSYPPPVPLGRAIDPPRSFTDPAGGVIVEFVAAWKNLTYIRCAESHLPHATWKAVAATQNTWMRNARETSDIDSADELPANILPLPIGAAGAQQHRPIRRSKDIRPFHAARWINDFRKLQQCSPIVFDFGG